MMWKNLSWQERQMWVAKIKFELDSGEKPQILAEKLKIPQPFLNVILKRTYSLLMHDTGRIKYELTEKGKKDYKMWKMLNSYQGEEQSNNFSVL